MKVSVRTIDQQLSDNVLRDHVSKDLQSKEMSAFEMEKKDSARTWRVGSADVELNALEIRSAQVTDERLRT